MNVTEALNIFKMCELRLGCLQWDRGVGGAQQEETGAEGEDRGERESPSGVSGL